MPTNSVLPRAFSARPQVASLYRPGMTQQQFQAALAADPGYQAILHDRANRAPNGQLTPQGWAKANQYAGSAGLYDLNAASRAGTSPSGAFHGGPSAYGVGGNGEVTEQHDSAWNPETAGTLLGIGLGVAAGGTALGAFGGGGSTGGAAASTVPPAVTTGHMTAANFLNSPAGTTIIGNGIGAAVNLYGANKKASSDREAAELEAAAKDKELAYLREKDRQDQLNWERTQAFNIDQYNQRLDRLSPYIGMGKAANTTLASLIGGPSFVAATQQPQPHASLPPQAGSPTSTSGNIQAAASMFLDGVQKAGLDPVAVQGHGQQIAAAVNRIHPELQLTVDPRTDAIVWNGIPLDVTVDSGKGGWSFRPSGGTSAAAPRTTTAASLFGLPSTLALLNDDTSTPMQTPRVGVDRTVPTANNFLRYAA